MAPRRGGEARSVIPDAQLELVGPGAEPDGHLPGPAVLGRVGDSFLRNPIQVRGDGIVEDHNRSLADEAAADSEAITGGFGQFFQGRRQTFRFQANGEEAARQLTRLGDGLIEAIGYSPRHLRLWSSMRAEFVLQRVGVEGEAYQVLAKAVVYVLANAGVLAVADLKDLVLQVVTFAFGPDTRNGAGSVNGNGLKGNPRLSWDHVGRMRGQVKCADDLSLGIKGDKGNCPEALEELGCAVRDWQVRKGVEDDLALAQQFHMQAVSRIMRHFLGKGGREAKVGG